MSIAPGVVFGHYEVRSRLGAGGMGEVFRARDIRLDRDIAVKVLPSIVSRDPDRLALFIREAKILASLNHPGIGAIYGLEELPSGNRCLILELVNGESLAERLRAGALPSEEACRLCAAIAEALEAAHASGVIHRDLKPGNVMLTERGGVKVLDFGLARRVGSGRPDQRAGAADLRPPTTAGDATTETLKQLIEHDAIDGTPGYMSPEQCLGEKQDLRTDIFSFGCVLYECLTGKRAFGGRHPLEVMAATLTSSPSWSALPAQTPPPVRDLLERCLEKEPARRLDRIAVARLTLEGAKGAPAMPAAGTPTPSSNLPREIKSFVGRERELAECARLLDGTRLLTLTGIGGCGKTRLARRLAGDLLGSYPDGVWFVDLAPLNDPDRVPLTVATALGVSEQPTVPLTRTLTAHLETRRALLILDNCEHLLVACARLAETLLASSAHLKLLATSRERLGIAGEIVLAVQPLTLPSRAVENQLRSVMSSDSGKLFVDRARAVDFGFGLDQTNARAVAEICRRLDGIPLAIELAANRVRMLTVDQIGERLDDRFRLLADGSRAAIPRHQTLLATIQWSYDHLTASEKQLFRRLSVFSGGWTLAAATTVAGEGGDEFAVLDEMTRLADKSLVVVDRGSSREARYTLLESVKQFAMERLAESGEEAEIRSRHLAYYLSLAQEIGRAGAREDACRLVDLDLENMISAHAWCGRAEERAEKGLLLAFALRNHWLPRGTLDLGLRISLEALSRPGAALPTPLRGRVLLTAGVLAYFTGRYAEGGELLDECLAILRESADPPTLATTLTARALICMARRDNDGAEEHLTEAVRLAREPDGRMSLSNVLNTLGDLYRIRGEPEAATAAYEEAIDLNRAAGNALDAAINNCNLGRVWIDRRDLARSRAILAELLAAAGGLDAKHVLWGILDVATGLALARGEYELGARSLGAADAQLGQSSSRRDIADQLFLEPLVARARSALGETRFTALYNAGRETPHEVIFREIAAWLAAG